MYLRTQIRMTDLLSPQKKQWNNILKVLWENIVNLSYPLKRSFKNKTDKEILTYRKSKEFIS